MVEIPNPHDRFFKELFSQRETAADFVRHYLPEAFVAQLDLTRLTIVKESFIDEELRQYFSDLLLRVRLKQGRAVFIYLLLEHKSKPDEFVALQLLVYLAQIWRPFLGKRTKPLPLVFPIVFYHGTASWKANRNFQSLCDFTGLEMLREYLPGFQYHVCDLSKLEINRGGARLRAGLLALKYVASAELPQRLREIFAAAKGLPKRLVMGYIKTILKYLLGAKTVLKPETIKPEVDAAFPEQLEEIMRSVAEVWIKEGEQRGEERGKQIGEQIGEQREAAKLALRQLHRRFGILGAELDERIRALVTEQLENLSEALLFFTTKDDLLNWLQINANSQSNEAAR
ncbi:MAG: Rpn family recombination-promoting nuclease/putative transposase [Acidobacteria bacterium]|nr:Rpn family recombination-promoting nuclease/putative transposase [Acidobacteriota bacterium]